MHMEVTIEVERSRIIFALHPSEIERKSTYGEKIGDILEFKLAAAEPVDFYNIHSDHLALIALLACHPFSVGDLKIPVPVSPQFKQACEKFVRYKPVFLSGKNKPYFPKSKGKPGLAFSGGIDSTAALAVMPSSTVPVFLDRPHRKNTTLYNKTAAKATLAFLEAKGVPNISISTDIEFIRNPIGFPTDLASGIPAIAIATHFNFDSIAYGTVMESAYRIGHVKSRDYSKSPHYKIWAPLFKAAGLPLFLPVAGVSEVGTSLIVHQSSFRGMGRSCIRGQWPNPCNKCWKCFRKQLVEDAICNRNYDDGQFSLAIQSKEVSTKLSSAFISHENVIAWALKKMDRGPKIELLYNRLVGSTYSLNHLESFCSLSIELMPPKYRLQTSENLRKYLTQMKKEEEGLMISQDFTEYTASATYHQKMSSFSNLIHR